MTSILLENGFRLEMTAETDVPGLVAKSHAIVTLDILLGGDRSKAQIIDDLINHLSWIPNGSQE